jgi:hypothetical protein
VTLIADGWLTFWLLPKSDAFHGAALAKEFAREGSRHQGLDAFEVVSLLPVTIADDVESRADLLRAMLALNLGA